MKPPPTSYTGSSTDWINLTGSQRQRVKQKAAGIKRIDHRAGKGPRPVHTVLKVTHIPTCFDGTLAEWNLLTSQQRYELKYTEYNRKKAADKKAKRESNWKKRGRALKVAPITYKGSVLEWAEMCPFRRRRIRLTDRSLEYVQEKARRCRQAADWFEKWGSKDAILASRKALELEKNRGKPWAATHARNEAMEASFEAVDTV